ncbi:FliI/YscN family ATPase [Halovulum sp. GXIMD14793]
MFLDFSPLVSDISAIRPVQCCGKVTSVGGATLDIAGIGRQARVGDVVTVEARDGLIAEGEVVAMSQSGVKVMTYGPCDGVGLLDPVRLLPAVDICPSDAWIGRVVDAFGRPLDGHPLERGLIATNLKAAPPPAADRKPVGPRLRTGVAAMDTMLPLARGQRIGIFAGSGVGKSSLLATLARGVEADVVVFALIGERGREVRHFIDEVLGPEGMARSVVVSATSDQSPLLKRRAGWLAMSIAEHFRDTGRHVLLLADSITRMAESHREIALTAGEAASLRAFPPSTANLISGFAERAGPGCIGTGDITAVFSVLVAGSDMEEPVADITRGVLDGHIVLDRSIAERGRFPAIDVRRSVSRSLPDAATPDENAQIERARRVLGTYEMAAPMIQTGLYSAGSDPQIDEAIRVWPKLDQLFARTNLPTPKDAFREVLACFEDQAAGE